MADLVESGQWWQGVTATKRWMDRRDSLRFGGQVAPRPVPPEVAALYLEFVARPRRGPVLDIGCGRGVRRQHFPSGYIGLDALAEWGDGSFPFVQAMAERLPWADATFDAVLSVEAFDHFLDPRQAAAEALRVLRPGGDLLVFLRTGAGEDPEEIAVHRFIFDEPGLVALFRDGLRRYWVAHDDAYLVLLGERGVGDAGAWTEARREVLPHQGRR